MATKPIEDLRAQAQEIKNETAPQANTALRVGGCIEDIVDTFSSQIGDLSSVLDTINRVEI